MTELRLCLRWKEIFGTFGVHERRCLQRWRLPAEISEDRYNSQRDRCRVYIHVNLHVEYIYPRHTNTHMYTLHTSICRYIHDKNYTADIYHHNHHNHQVHHQLPMREQQEPSRYHPETERDQTTGVVSLTWFL